MKTKRLHRQSNPQLLDLLKKGATIVLPDGRWLSGDVRDCSIVIGLDYHTNRSSIGVWNLDREGLRHALGDSDFQEMNGH